MVEEPLPPAEDRPAPNGQTPGRSVWWGLKLMLLGWAVGFTAAGLVHLVFHTEGVNVVGNIAGLSVMAWVGYRTSGQPFRRAFAIRGFSPGLLLPMVLMAVGGTMLVSEVGNLMEEIVPIPQSIREILIRILMADDWQGFLWRAALLSLMAPVTEEVVFRGIFLYRFTQRYGAARGVAASAVCFGVFHLIPWQAVTTTLVGVLLGAVVYRTGSIFAGMAMHAIWNLLPLLAVSLLKGAVLPGYDLQSTEVHHVPVSALVVSAGILLLGLRALWRRTEPLHPALDLELPVPPIEEGAAHDGLPPEAPDVDRPDDRRDGASGPWTSM